jgi:hypothetical protein
MSGLIVHVAIDPAAPLDWCSVCRKDTVVPMVLGTLSESGVTVSSNGVCTDEQHQERAWPA